MEQLTFTEVDAKFLEDFGVFLHRHMRIHDCTVADALQLNKYLVQYQQLHKKIADHILEVRRVVEAPKEEPKARKAK